MNINTVTAHEGFADVPQQPFAPQRTGSVSWSSGHNSNVAHSDSPHLGGAQAPANYDQIEGVRDEPAEVEISLNQRGAKLNSAHARPPLTLKTRLLAILRCVMDNPRLLFPPYAIFVVHQWCMKRYLEASLQRLLQERYSAFRNRTQPLSTGVPVGEDFADQPEGVLSPSSPEIEPKDQPAWTYQ